MAIVEKSSNVIVAWILTISMTMALVLGPPLKNAEASEALDLDLVMTMAGVTAGTIKLSIDDQDSRTVSQLSMKSKGLFKLMTGYKSKSAAHSSNGADGGLPMPILYDSTYRTKSGERRVEIRYDGETGDISSLGTWKRGEPRKSKVPAAMRAETIDPLTAMVRFRHWIRGLRGDDGVQKAGLAEPGSKVQLFDVFDGRRRYQLQIQLLERLEADHAGGRVSAFRFRVDLKAIAGFSKRDMLANWSSEDGQRWIEVIVTDDDNPIPLSMATIGGSLKTSVQLRKVCDDEGDCVEVRN